MNDQPAPVPGGEQPPMQPPPSPSPPGQWGEPSPPQAGGWGAPPPGAGYSGQTPAQPYQPGGWQSMAPIHTAEPGLRIAAKFIDIVIFVIIQVVLGIISAVVVGFSLLTTTSGSSTLTGSSAFSNPFGGVSLLATLAIGLVTIAVDYVYNVVCVSKFGGQPGKLMLGLRVVGADGSTPSTGTALRRWSPILALSVIGMLPFVSLFGMLARFVLLVANLVLVVADDQRRSVFDHVGGTTVVMAR